MCVCVCVCVHEAGGEVGRGSTEQRQIERRVWSICPPTCPGGMVPGGLREQTLHEVEPASEKLSIRVEGLYGTEEQVRKDELEETVSGIRSTCICWEIV